MKVFSKKRLLASLALKGKTLGELANYIGIDPSTLTRKVHGRSEWTRAEIQKTCEFLEIDSPKQIFFVDGDA